MGIGKRKVFRTYNSAISAETFTHVSLCGAILKYTTITNFFLRCHSHRASIGWIKQKSDSNC